jgi:Uma2 family endonuclease
MATTRTSFEEYMRLPDDGARHELDEGDLLMVPSPAPRHNLIRQRIAFRMTQFVTDHKLGIVLEEMDFRLAPETVRNADVAFVAKEALRNVDFDRSPIEGAPTLAVEVLSPGNRTEDTVKKVQQYFDAGCRSVWLVYPTLRLVEIHSRLNTRPERRDIRELDVIVDDAILPGFSLPVSFVLNEPELD